MLKIIISSNDALNGTYVQHDGDDWTGDDRIEAEAWCNKINGMFNGYRYSVVEVDA